MVQPLIEIRDAVRNYDEGRITALRGVNLTINAVESVSILGPSGSGKTTLLNLMSGLDRPTGGSVFFEGREIKTVRQWMGIRARRIGYVFQAFNLMPVMSAAENIEIPMFGVIRGTRTRARRVSELLDLVGLSARAAHRPAKLSGGERQRVAIARALANSPGLILADEPTGNLDSQNAIMIMELLKNIHHAQKTTLVIVTHNTEVAACCERLVSIVDGLIVGDAQNPDAR
ncbi:MAG: ABC transporter ATP-binding protein [Candidatus Sumerlaeota bacterium]|nr:ABC transporter ATP-binding protein [Candidatus Sumerlaeota bacterium]